MKKLLLMLSLTLVLNGCKQKDSTQEKATEKQALPLVARNDCSFFEPLDTMTVANQVMWLRENQIEACLAKYDICRERAHKIPEAAYTDALNKYWDGRPVKYSHYTLKQIKDLSTHTNYEKFIKMANDSEKIVLSSSTDFTTDPTCYAIPLFYSLERIHNLNESSEFNFTLGVIDGNLSVIFNITGVSRFYDVSHFPL